MPRLKNTGTPVHLYRPPGDYGSQFVAHGEVITLSGRVTEDTSAAYVVDSGGQQRAWPKSRWKLVTETTTSKKKPENTDSTGEES